MNRRKLWLLSLVCCTVSLAWTAEDPAPLEVTQYTGPIRVACVGDSITFGAGIKDRAHDSYPAQLQRLLGDKWQVHNFGVSAATLLKKGNKPYHKLPAHDAALALKPDVVVLKLGTNDSKPPNWKHKDEFDADCRSLIAEFRKANPKVRVYLCFPVPAFPGRWGISDEVIRTEVIPLLKQVAAEEHCPVIDLYTALSGKGDLFPDTVHPNVQGAGLIAAAVYRALTGNEVPKQQ